MTTRYNGSGRWVIGDEEFAHFLPFVASLVPSLVKAGGAALRYFGSAAKEGVVNRITGSAPQEEVEADPESDELLGEAFDVYHDSAAGEFHLVMPDGEEIDDSSGAAMAEIMDGYLDAVLEQGIPVADSEEETAYSEAPVHDDFAHLKKFKKKFKKLKKLAKVVAPMAAGFVPGGSSLLAVGSSLASKKGRKGAGRQLAGQLLGEGATSSIQSLSQALDDRARAFAGDVR